MKLTTRTSYSRTDRHHPSIDGQPGYKQYSTPRKQSMPVALHGRSHHKKRQTCPEIIYRTRHLSPGDENNQDLWKTNPRQQVSGNKLEQMNSKKSEWKILTLEQIKRQRQPKIVEESTAGNSRKKSGQKLYVSISKSNRSSSSRSSLSRDHNITKMGGQHAFLSSFNSNARIVDKVQLQLQESFGFKRFLC